jgi:hypothetical protein
MDRAGGFWAHARVSALQERVALLTRLLGLEALAVVRDEEAEQAEDSGSDPQKLPARERAAEAAGVG